MRKILKYVEGSVWVELNEIHSSLYRGKIMFVSRAYEGCVISKSELRKVYERFVEKRSWKTEDYRNSRHASYFLRLLKEYFKA